MVEDGESRHLGLASPGVHVGARAQVPLVRWLGGQGHLILKKDLNTMKKNSEKKEYRQKILM